jgi:hypothetical protein
MGKKNKVLEKRHIIIKIALTSRPSYYTFGNPDTISIVTFSIGLNRIGNNYKLP